MKKVKYIFWIHSNRGTREIENIALDSYLDNDKEGIKAELENWCSRFGAWSHSDNIVAYGWLKDSKAAQRKISKYYKAQGIEHQKIDDCISKKITPEKLSEWFKKNKKVLKFPFK